MTYLLSLHERDAPDAAYRCTSVDLYGKRCDLAPAHEGAHIHETPNGVYGWMNNDS